MSFAILLQVAQCSVTTNNAMLLFDTCDSLQSDLLVNANMHKIDAGQISNSLYNCLNCSVNANSVYNSTFAQLSSSYIENSDISLLIQNNQYSMTSLKNSVIRNYETTTNAEVTLNKTDIKFINQQLSNSLEIIASSNSHIVLQNVTSTQSITLKLTNSELILTNNALSQLSITQCTDSVIVVTQYNQIYQQIINSIQNSNNCRFNFTVANSINSTLLYNVVNNINQVSDSQFNINISLFSYKSIDYAVANSMDNIQSSAFNIIEHISSAFIQTVAIARSLQNTIQNNDIVYNIYEYNIQVSQFERSSLNLYNFEMSGQNTQNTQNYVILSISDMSGVINYQNAATVHSSSYSGLQSVSNTFQSINIPREVFSFSDQYLHYGETAQGNAFSCTTTQALEPAQFRCLDLAYTTEIPGKSFYSQYKTFLILLFIFLAVFIIILGILIYILVLKNIFTKSHAIKQKKAKKSKNGAKSSKSANKQAVINDTSKFKPVSIKLSNNNSSLISDIPKQKSKEYGFRTVNDGSEESDDDYLKLMNQQMKIDQSQLGNAYKADSVLSNEKQRYTIKKGEKQYQKVQIDGNSQIELPTKEDTVNNIEDGDLVVQGSNLIK